MLNTHSVVGLILTGVIIAGLLGCSSAPERGQQASLTPRTLDREYRERVKLSYLLYEPAGKPPAEGWPVVLFLHGAGERGDDLELVKKWGPPLLLDKGEGRWADFGAIVVSPQCPAGERWRVNQLLALLDEIQQKHRADEDRVYVTGLSMGGFGTWALADHAPERFAAIAPICGGYPYLPYAAGERLTDLPVWAFHGAADDVVPVWLTTMVVDAIKNKGGDVRSTIYQGVGHISWDRAYASDELWEWMLNQRRAPRE